MEKVKICQIGDSLKVTIPATIARMLGITKGDSMSVDKAGNQLIYQKVEP